MNYRRSERDSAKYKIIEAKRQAIVRTQDLNIKIQRRIETPAPIQKTILPFKKFDSLSAKYKHSGDIGDLLYSLPVIKETGGGALYINCSYMGNKMDGSKSGFNINILNFLKPLLESQKYIKKVEAWNNNPIDVDLDYFRSLNLNCATLCQSILNSFSVSMDVTNAPWIECNKKKITSAVFARSFRYRNENVDYKQYLEKYKDDCIFVGLIEEHSDFVKMFGHIRYYQVANMLEMAEIINGADIFIGNQSSPMSLAIALHKPFVQEVFSKVPDCKFDRPNCTYI